MIQRVPFVTRIGTEQGERAKDLAIEQLFGAENQCLVESLRELIHP